MSTSTASPGVSPILPRTSGLEPTALWTLFTLTLRGYVRGRRVIVLLLLSLLPAALAMYGRFTFGASRSGEIEFSVFFLMIPHSVLPLIALLYGTGMVLDEQEEQTLTYLLIRPLPKKALYFTKFLATVTMVGLLGAFVVVVTFAAIYAGSSEFWDVFPLKMLKTLGVVLLALMTYTAVFGCLSLLVKRYLIASILYVVVIEFILGNLNFVFRNLTVIYYFRVMALQWLDINKLSSQSWSIELTDAPEQASVRRRCSWPPLRRRCWGRASFRAASSTSRLRKRGDEPTEPRTQ